MIPLIHYVLFSSALLLIGGYHIDIDHGIYPFVTSSSPTPAGMAPEGKEVRVPYRGPVEPSLQAILGGLRSACSYVGAWRIKDLSKCTTFVRVTRTTNEVYKSFDVAD